MKRFPNRLGGKRVFAIGILVWGFALTLGRGSVRAQEPADVLSGTHDDATEVSAPTPTAPATDSSVSVPLTLSFGERVKIYEHSFTNPESIFGPALGAGVGQWRDTPPEWGQGAHGYGLRLASGFGRSITARTIAFGVAAVDHEDPRFVPSNETGVWRRARHAIVGTFVSRTETGGTMPAVSRFVGVYGAGFIANAWEPPSQDNTRDALLRGSTALLSSVGWHVLQEFWPDVKGIFHRN